ncbi:MAG TPA: hypothetical protein VFR09_04360 [Alphaproteobacteria bacterium]|nr:hypothetical protein [Alphaproteobacteria bacterium]
MPLPNKSNAPKVSKEPPAVLLGRGVLDQMNRLFDIMKLENDLVVMRKIEEHKQLLKDKQRLTMDYRANMKSIAIQPGILSQLPKELLSESRISAQKLAEMSDRNAKCLRGAVVATQRLVQSVVAIVKQEVVPKPGYRNPGVAPIGAAAYSPTCKPVAVSRTA